MATIPGYFLTASYLEKAKDSLKSSRRFLLFVEIATKHTKRAFNKSFSLQAKIGNYQTRS
jgi:hypothetical protein